jgi:hypothetical protein
VNFALQYAGNFHENLRVFLANDFHPKAGMKFLIQSFYRSIIEDRPLPISYREILLTSRIMDSIFRNLNTPKRENMDELQTLGSVYPLSGNTAAKLPRS